MEILFYVFESARQQRNRKHYLTLSGLNLHCHLHPLQAANCCRNSRLAVDEDDLKWVKKHVLVNQFHGNIHFKTLGCRKTILFSGM